MGKGTGWVKSKFPGVRYREHDVRRHGVGFDRYYTLTYKLDGKTRTEAVGWASQGWTEKKAAGLMAEIRENQRRGEGPRTLQEKRNLAEQKREEMERLAVLKERAALTFGEVFEVNYLPHSKATKCHIRSWQREESLSRLWIKPVIGTKAMIDISAFDLERIKRNMAKAGRSPRTIHYCLAVIRQVYRFARRNDLYRGDIPTEKVSKPKYDNRRMRYLSHDEAEALLKELESRSRDLHDMALLSLHTGMRAGEIFNLTWGCVDLEHAQVTLFDTKNTRSRTVFLNDRAMSMMKDRETGKPNDLVFMARGGGKIKEISNAFDRAVSSLGFNEGITDRRQKVTFHSLRHTHASWLVEDGTDLYTVKELLGHRDFAMTARYSHLGAESLRQAVKRLDKASIAEIVAIA